MKIYFVFIVHPISIDKTTYKGMANIKRLNQFQREVNKQKQWDFSDLKAIFLNCTLKKSPRLPHTSGLIDIRNDYAGK